MEAMLAFMEALLTFLFLGGARAGQVPGPEREGDNVIPVWCYGIFPILTKIVVRRRVWCYGTDEEMSTACSTDVRYGETNSGTDARYDRFRY